MTGENWVQVVVTGVISAIVATFAFARFVVVHYSQSIRLAIDAQREAYSALLDRIEAVEKKIEEQVVVLRRIVERLSEK